MKWWLFVGCWLLFVVAGAGAVALFFFCNIDWQDSWRNY